MAKKRILIVDDEKSFTQMLKMNLEEICNYEVRTENAGVRALAAVKAFKPDLVLLDIIMPDVTGDHVAAQIEADANVRNTPIVFLTATIRKAEADSRGGIIGGHLFLSKPVSMEELIDCIEENTQVPVQSQGATEESEKVLVSPNPFRWLTALWKRGRLG